MLFAAIDIGSNAARLLFANAHTKNGLIKVEKASIIRIPTRLGIDVYNNKKISKERARHFIKTMKAFKLLIELYNPIGYKAYATAAMREAENSEELLKKVKKETGLKIRIIDGQQEAEIIRTTNRMVFPNPKPYALFMDVGGGSTELSIEKDGKLLKLKSFKIGALRLLHGTVKENVWNHMHQWLDEYKNQFSNFHFVGTGGNINKLCKSYGNSQTQQLNIGNLDFAYKQLKILSIEERIEKFGFRPDRADVIVPAASIYLHVMNHIGAEIMQVPRIGLADGLIMQQYKKYMNNNN